MYRQSLTSTSRLDPAHQTIDADDAIEVSGQIAAVELDLEMDQSVPLDPFLERVRQAVVEPRLTSTASIGSLAPTEWNTGKRGSIGAVRT